MHGTRHSRKGQASAFATVNGVASVRAPSVCRPSRMRLWFEAQSVSEHPDDRVRPTPSIRRCHGGRVPEAIERRQGRRWLGRNPHVQEVPISTRRAGAGPDGRGMAAWLIHGHAVAVEGADHQRPPRGRPFRGCPRYGRNRLGRQTPGDRHPPAPLRLKVQPASKFLCVWKRRCRNRITRP